MMKKHAGFTVIELVVVIAFLVAIAVFGFSQFTHIKNESDNSKRRTSINAIYYSLEENYYVKNGYYPEKIDDKTLTTMDAELLKDPDGVKLDEPESDYRYEPANCTDGKCKSYKLRALLINESDYIKDSRHK